ncbi:hypothetical protein CAEBREN_11509 [Caenorhabditis brenneri]|uniref:Uncharacterized protein n=1 Tax=Caenorhabditis brenneri TaxID=135651 RepID=G0NJ26_CAEBE|nr:hypothetical protein CAEBREN_11509 [Caenorhabditis brenneri]
MSLLPLNTLSEAGCLFIEARLLGGPGNIVSQIGLTVDAPNTSIAVFCEFLIQEESLKSSLKPEAGHKGRMRNRIKKKQKRYWPSGAVKRFRNDEMKRAVQLASK